MVREQMTPVDQVARERGLRLERLADDEERAPRAVLLEDVGGRHDAKKLAVLVLHEGHVSG